MLREEEADDGRRDSDGVDVAEVVEAERDGGVVTAGKGYGSQLSIGRIR